jgi:hypothetical protein
MKTNVKRVKALDKCRVEFGYPYTHAYGDALRLAMRLAKQLDAIAAIAKAKPQ